MKNIINKLKSAPSKNVVIVGDVMLDEYIFGSVGRVSPEAPVPVLRKERNEWRLGGAANVALNCKHIGFNVNLIGVIGRDDRSGAKLCSILTQHGMAVSGLVKSSERVTTCKKRALANSQQLLRIDSEDTKELSDKEFFNVLEQIEKAIVPGAIILVSDYAKGVVTKDLLSRIILIAQKHNCLVLIDPKGREFDKYKNINYLKPNYKEYCQILEYYGLSNNDSVSVNGKIICEKLNINGLIVTLGEKGIHFVSQKEDIWIPACKKEVFDLTGAGDTVFAFLALGLAHRLSMKDCLNLANNAAGVAVSHLKTYAVSLEELIDRDAYMSEKIFENWNDLKTKLDQLKLEKNRIVFTNGSFDLIHSGHIHVLNESKKQGDILVVALNTDNSIKRYKGKNRPIKTLEERAMVMSAFGVVDFVVFFDQDTPKELIEYLKPDVLVKGGDYKKEEIVGARFMKSSGGKVVIVDFQTGKSTTNLVKMISS